MTVLFMSRDMKKTNSSCTAILLKNSWFHFSMNYTKLHSTSTITFFEAERSKVHASVFNLRKKRLS